MGIHVHREKVIAFATAASMAGAAGSRLAHYMLFISPTIFVGDFSTTILSMVVLGGMGLYAGQRDRGHPADGGIPRVGPSEVWTNTG